VKRSQSGVVMLVVLGAIMVVIILANIIMTLMSSQSRLTHHQVSRIQAYYAAMGAINYTYEQLRQRVWQAGETHTIPFDLGNDFRPASIVSVTVTIVPSQNTNLIAPCYRPILDGTACISAFVDYTRPVAS